VDEVQLVNYLLDALANTHRLLGDYAAAERLLRQALQQAEEGQSPYEVATYSVSAAVLAEEQGDIEQAEELLRSAIESLSSSGAKRDLARARFHMARTLFAAGKPEMAVEELKATLELSRELGYDAFMVAEGQRAGKLISWALARGEGGRRLELVAERLRAATQPLQIGHPPRIRVQPAGPLRIEAYSLGPSRVLVDARTITSSDWAVEKTKELFFYLLMHSQPLRKDQVVDDVWPDVELGKSNSQFHSTMYRLRRALFPQCVTFRDGRYQLTLGKIYWFDAEQFDRLVDKGDLPDLARRERVEAYQRAIDLYKGPFLEEFYSDWVIPYRERLEIRYLQALTRLAKLKAQDGELQQALDLLRIAVGTDPFREEAHYGLVHYSALMGDPAAALRHYRSYFELLRDELRATPSPAFQTLVDSIARGQAVPSL